MNRLQNGAKKAISVILTIGMIISLFSCMSGLSVFAIDNAPLTVKEEVKAESVVTAEPANPEVAHTHCMCGGENNYAFMHNTHKNITFTGVSTADEMKTNGSRWGNFYLLNDIEISGTITFMWETHICLNGHKLILKKGTMFAAAPTLSSKQVFSFCDCVGTGAIEQMEGQGDTQSSSATIFALTDPNPEKFCFDLYFFGVKVDLKDSHGYSGLAVGTIKNSTTGTSGTGSSNLYILGSTFIGSPNTRAASGGLVQMNGTGTCYCYNAKMTGSYVKEKGSIFNMLGASTLKIYSGTYNMGGKHWGTPRPDGASTGGSGSGGLICGGADSFIDIQGGTLTYDGIADYQYAQGGIVYTNGKLSIGTSTGGPVLNGNADKNMAWGNAVLLNSSSTESQIIGKAKIHGGYASKGGAIYKAGAGKLTISLDEDGIIDDTLIGEGNACSIGGSDIWIESGTVDITSGTITGGAAAAGGAIYSNKGTLNLSGGTINGCTTNGNGGAMYFAPGSTFNMTGGTVNGGTVVGAEGKKFHGGAIYALGTTVEISGGTVNAGKFTNTPSDASPAGGAIYSIYNSESQPGSFHLSGTAEVFGSTDTEADMVSSGGAIYVTNPNSLIEGNVHVVGGNAKFGGAIRHTRQLTINLGEEGVIEQGDLEGITESGGALSSGGTLTVTGTGKIIGKSVTAAGEAIYGSEDSTVNVSGCEITGDVYAAGKLNVSGEVALDEVHGLSKSEIDITDAAEIGDLILTRTDKDNGATVTIHEFEGNVEAVKLIGKSSKRTSGKIGANWDKDYIASEQVGFEADAEGAPYFVGKVDAENVVYAVLVTLEDAIKEVKAMEPTDDVNLANIDTIIAACGADAAVQALYEFDAAKYADMYAKAQEMADMFGTKVEVVEWGEEDDRYLYVVYAGLDAEHFDKYEEARVIITINNKTVGEDEEITDVYEEVQIDNDHILNLGADKFIFFKTVSFAKTTVEANPDVTYNFQVKALFDGEWVTGKAISGKLGTLVPAEEPVE